MQHRHVHTVIHLRVAAPAKPPPGAPCNGCGVCCTAAPCPVGMLVSGRTRGACAALRWEGEPLGPGDTGGMADLDPHAHGDSGAATAAPVTAAAADPNADSDATADGGPTAGRYRCGLISAPAVYLPARWAAAAPLLVRIARRYIAAGAGCDCELEATPEASAVVPPACQLRS